ncbi:hypothetical protein [Youngiibacter multivorans]|uniref:Uncharacterized protein n=1 Tax=Youngiibacter multivorans TaxID=937251 RepID=A0ABS4G8U5_9CLOT|nr:hypothetical protein [Youngiibacter multivorans]MBP1920962.1 hypothetical protein [Youngiibacter multivorans]
MVDVIAEKAKRNQEATHLIGKGKQSKDMASQEVVKPIDTNKELGKIAGVSKMTAVNICAKCSFRE